MYSWLQNLLNLKNIFDKYLPKVREAYALVMKQKEYFDIVNTKIKELQKQIQVLKEKDAGEVIDITAEELEAKEAEVKEETKEEDNAVA